MFDATPQTPPEGLVLARDRAVRALAAPFLPRARLVAGAGRSARLGAVLTGPGGDDAAAADARRRGARLLSVRPGLLSTVGLARPSEAPVSLLLDEGAAYASIVARLEDRSWLTDPTRAEAEALSELWLEESLSSPHGGAPPDLPSHAGGWLLVLDEPGLPAATLEAVVAAARAAHPGARIVVRTTRAVVAGADRIVGPRTDLPALIARVGAVFTWANPVGLEAILRGRPVTTLGAPFYAGLGLTQDLGQVVRRPVASAVEAFAAAYVAAPLYVDPLTRAPCAPAVAFERFAAFTRHARRVAGAWRLVGIPEPKHRSMRDFLAGPFSTVERRGGPGVRPVVWASTRRPLTPGAVRMEDGFVRSVGLGSSFTPAASLVLDARGIYYDPSAPSDLEVLLNEAAFTSAELAKARRLVRRINALGLSKYNIGGARPCLPRAQGRRVLLVPGQVEDDASLIHGGGRRSNLWLLGEVRRTNPDAFIVFKEHPDVSARNRRGRIAGADEQALADVVVRHGDITACLDAADEVHTLTSLTGFEALLRGKPVTTYGMPFYAGWGLTTDREAPPRPRRSLTLEALVAGALVRYPLYLDPATRLPCDVETYLERLGQARPAATRPPAGPVTRLARAAALIAGARPAAAY